LHLPGLKSLLPLIENIPLFSQQIYLLGNDKAGCFGYSIIVPHPADGWGNPNLMTGLVVTLFN
jgi:hypothetical protein